MNLEVAAQQPRGFVRVFADRLRGSAVLDKAAFLALWEAQSHLASIACVGLVALTSVWLTLGVMLVWSLMATFVYFTARERGYPNLLNSHRRPQEWTRRSVAIVAAASVARAWVAGLAAFAFARCSENVLRHQAATISRRLLRWGAIGLGLTLFGVTVAEHTLRCAGYTGSQLKRMGLAAPFLNVPYRVLMSAALIAFLRHTFGVFV